LDKIIDLIKPYKGNATPIIQAVQKIEKNLQENYKKVRIRDIDLNPALEWIQIRLL